MMQEVEVLKTIQELICSFFSEEQFTLSYCLPTLHFPPASCIIFFTEHTFFPSCVCGLMLAV